MKQDYKLMKILHLLSKNSRMSSKEVAKEIQTSQQNASYLISKLFSDNYVRSSKLLIDSSKFGHNNFCVFIRLKKTSKDFSKGLIKALKKYKEITSIDFLFGNYDLFLRFTTPNASYFNKLFREILNSYSKEIVNYNILTQIVEYFYPNNYLSKKNFNQKIIISGDREFIYTDDLDKGIIDSLNENSRENFAHIANKLHVTSKTVIERVKKLIKKGIIKGYGITLNHKKLLITRNHIFLKFNFIETKKEKLLNKFIHEHPNVIEFIKVFGDWDAILIVESIKLDDFKKLLFFLKEEFAEIILDYDFLESEDVKLWKYLPMFKDN